MFSALSKAPEEKRLEQEKFEEEASNHNTIGEDGVPSSSVPAYSPHNNGESLPRDSSHSNSISEEIEAEARAQDVEARDSESASAPPYSVFTKNEKRYIVFMVALAGFFSPLSANIYFPALPQLSSAMHVSTELINLTITSYMIFQGLSPAVFGDLSDAFGRRPAYVIAFTIYLAANIGLATQNSYAALLVLRCLQSTGSSVTIALGNGVVADIATSAERGGYMGLAVAGAMFGPAIGIPLDLKI